MNVKSVSFKNYKGFYEQQTMQLKPITILIGKNSSGKSAIAKLFPLFETSLMGNIDEPLLLKNNGVELGAEFDNLFFGNNPGGISLQFKIVFENNQEIEVSLRKNHEDYGLYIFQWRYKNNHQKIELELDHNTYIDTLTKESYQCQFKGFIPTQLIKEKTGENTAEKFPVEKIDVDYIGPFRILPQRCFYLTGKTQFRDTGITGENAYAMLGISKLKGDDLYKNVGKWYKDHFDGWELKVDDTTRSPFVSIVLSKEKKEKTDIKNPDINIMDVGQGMNQALPLVVRANVKNRPNSMIILEQPELHLHPAAHGDLAELFAKSAKENNQTFIIETHSENILLRLRKLIVENDFGFTKDDLIIYWLEDAESEGKELREITVDDEGVLSDWPDGVFNEAMKEILARQKAVKRKKITTGN